MVGIKETGGARIGMANATWPFATLKVTKGKLELNASIIGNLVFRPADIISLVSLDGFVSKGRRINHRVSTYADNVIFWTFGNPNVLLMRIEETGFLTNTSPIPESVETEIINAQSKGDFPVKLSQ